MFTYHDRRCRERRSDSLGVIIVYFHEYVYGRREKVAFVFRMARLLPRRRAPERETGGQGEERSRKSLLPVEKKTLITRTADT